ncbi:MAG: hypothetical protein LBP89_10220 [Helicobacteraceae bacterium]|jgi:hypothetical protein|nr:hypothetical protein [Helicobacteraceae bacterium]
MSSELYPLAYLPPNYYIDLATSGHFMGLSNNVGAANKEVEKPAAGELSESEARDYYEGITTKMDFDLEPYIEIDAKQMKTNQEALYILDKNIGGGLDWFNYQIDTSMTLDPFYENPFSEARRQEFIRVSKIYEQIGKIQGQIFQQLIAAERKNDKVKAEALRKDLAEGNDEIKKLMKAAAKIEEKVTAMGRIDYYWNYTWYKPEEYMEVSKERIKNNFINLYQLSDDFVKSEEFEAAVEIYGKTSQRSLGSVLPLYVAKKGKSRGEWLELFENNAKILREHVYREGFDKRGLINKQLLTDAHALAERILADAYEMWGKGSELNVVA